MLNREGVPTPGEYFRKTHPKSRKYTASSAKISWTHGAVCAILRRYSYTGAFVGGMREQIAPCTKSCTKKKPEEWIIVPGMHEAIITPEEYDLAQKVISDRKYQGSGDPKAYPLKSLLICGNCLRRKHKQKVSLQIP